MIAGGQSSSPVSATEIYDGTSWTTSPASLTRGGAMASTAIAGASSTSALIFGGEPGTSYSTLSETWNGTSWSEGNDLNSLRQSAGGVGIVTAALACGGSSGGPVNQVESYDGTSWTETSTDINTARSAMGSSGTSILCLIFGGSGVSALTESFNGTTWTEVADLATARAYLGNSQSPTNTNAAALAFGGIPPATNVTEEWDAAPVTAKTVTTS
jgi:hypothetical protein